MNLAFYSGTLTTGGREMQDTGLYGTYFLMAIFQRRWIIAGKAATDAKKAVYMVLNKIACVRPLPMQVDRTPKTELPVFHPPRFDRWR